MIDAADLIDQIKNSTDTFQKQQCRHTLPEGRRCGSPAMRGEKFCYYHHDSRKPVADPQRRQARRNCFHIAPPRSRAAIQESIGEVITRLAYNEIDPRRAGLLLYALQIATTNIKDHQASQQANVKDQTAEPVNPSQDTFDAEVFPNDPITPETTAALYEPLVPTPPICSPDHEPQPAFAPTNPPVHVAPASTSSPASSSQPHPNSQLTQVPATLPNISACDDLSHQINNSSRPSIIPYVYKMSPKCHFIA